MSAKRTIFAGAALIAALLMAACATPIAEPEAAPPQPEQTPTFAEEPEVLEELMEEPAEGEPAAEPEEEAAAPAELAPIRVALLPVLDTLPLFVAQANGYFEEEGLQVEVIPVASPVERDQLMQAGEIDAMLNEISSTALFNREGTQVQIVYAARVPTEGGPVFRILAAPGSGLATPADLAGVPIGVSQNTIIEYTTDRLLEEEGLSPDEIVTESVPAIPERFQLLMSGQLQAANLPDPLAQAALEGGATLIVDDAAYPFYTISTVAFSLPAIESNPEGVRAFLRAWDRAVADLNSDPEAYRDLFLERVPVPEPVQATYQLPPFPRGEVPSEEQWADVMDWLVEKELLSEPVPYAESVNPNFLPEAAAAE